MADFPTLTRDPINNSHVETKARNPALRSNPEDGNIISRAQHTANKKRWEASYTLLTQADKVLLDSLQDEVMISSDVFNWTNPHQGDGTTYSVRLQDAIVFLPSEGNHTKWDARFTLIEV